MFPVGQFFNISRLIKLCRRFWAVCRTKAAPNKCRDDAVRANQSEFVVALVRDNDVIRCGDCSSTPLQPAER